MSAVTGAVSSRSARLIRSRAKTIPRMSSSVSPETGMREYSCSRKSARKSSSVASLRIATMSGRGVMTSRTMVSRNSTTVLISSRSSWASVSAVSSTESVGVASTTVTSSRSRSRSRSPGAMRATRRNAPVMGSSTAATTSNDGSSASRVSWGPRRRMICGTRCSATIRNPSTAKNSSTSECGFSMPISCANISPARTTMTPSRRRIGMKSEAASSR